MEAGSNEPNEVPLGDILNDVPLLREIQRVILSGTGPINWELARQIGIAVASWGLDDSAPTEQDRRGLEDTVRAAELAVADFTGLPVPTDVARVEAFRRGQWVEANIRSLREILEQVGGKLGGLLESQLANGGGQAFPVPPEAAGGEVLAGLMQKVVPLLLGAHMGQALGYLGQQVLGQFDLAVPREAGALYFVVPNIARFEKEWSLSPMEFRAWVALHEVTHRFEFAGAWVRPHFVGLVKDLLDNAEIDLSGLEERLSGLDLANPDALPEAFEGVTNLFGQTTNPEQRLRVARVQAFMAAAEGYGDHVMEHVGRSMLSSFPQIQEAVRRHREGRHADQALERLIGLEMKEEQYRLGREFCDRVAELTGEQTLCLVWSSPESMPSMPELEEPSLWLARMA
jgi:coenzyme F420 biosynthesis associated uncharacterized protein